MVAPWGCDTECGSRGGYCFSECGSKSAYTTGVAAEGCAAVVAARSCAAEYGSRGGCAAEEAAKGCAAAVAAEGLPAALRREANQSLGRRRVSHGWMVGGADWEVSIFLIPHLSWGGPNWEFWAHTPIIKLTYLSHLAIFVLGRSKL